MAGNEPLERSTTDRDSTQVIGERTEGASVTRGAARDAVAVQRARFGGVKWGAAFFGWLSANGLAVLLIALLSAAGVALGLANNVSTNQTADQAKTLGLGGGIAILVVLFLAYLAGGYVAGRMARFDGTRQGLGVWLWGILVAGAIALLAILGGSKYNVLDALNLPRIPIDQGHLTNGGAIALAAGLVVSLVAACIGGTLGARWHRRVDRHVIEEPA